MKWSVCEILSVRLIQHAVWFTSSSVDFSVRKALVFSSEYALFCYQCESDTRVNTHRPTDCWECAAVRFKVPRKYVCGVVRILKSAEWGHGWSGGIFLLGDSRVEHSASVGEHGLNILKWIIWWGMNRVLEGVLWWRLTFPLDLRVTFQDGFQPLSAVVEGYSQAHCICLWNIC